MPGDPLPPPSPFPAPVDPPAPAPAPDPPAPDPFNAHGQPIDLRNPSHLSALFLSGRFLDPGPPRQPLLRHWQQFFWTWHPDRPTWTRLSPATLQSQVLAWLSLNPRLGPPSTFRASEITACLAASLSLSLPDIPCWLSPAGIPRPGSPCPDYRFLSLQNGLLDISTPSTPTLRPHGPSWFSPSLLPFPFVPGAPCPLWDAHLSLCLEGDTHRASLLQEWYGYCLTPDTSQQKIMCFEGEGSNGKTVAVEVLRHLVGPENCSYVPLEAFGQRFQLFKTIGKLLNVCGDVAELDKVAEGHVKGFSSGDMLYCDLKGREGIDFRPTARLLLLFNQRPRFSDRSEAIWRRLLLMPWRIFIPEESRIPSYRESHRPDWPFLPELPGIFNWALAGLSRLRQAGRFTQPPVCQDALLDYRTQSNPARLFLSTRCLVAENASLPSDALYFTYRQWCQDRGYMPLAENSFGHEVFRVYPTIRRLRIWEHGVRIYVYRGLGYSTKDLEGTRGE